MTTTTLTLADIARDRAIELFHAGLYARPLSEQFKALYGTNHVALAEHPPTYAEISKADYSGGLAIINGAPHPATGYVMGIDMDRGPVDWPAHQHPDWILVEGGTGPGKRHVFCRTIDQLIGQVELFVRSEYDAWKANPYNATKNPNGVKRPAAVAEFKGKGVTALRSYPSQPENKPKGYTPVHLATHVSGAPELTAEQVIHTFAQLYRLKWGMDVIEVRHDIDTAPRAPLPDGLAREVERALADAGAHLGPVRGGGYQQGYCPFHDDKQKSLSVNFDKGGWKCFAGCGGGALTSLAIMLGLAVTRTGPRRGAGVSNEVIEQGPDPDFDTGHGYWDPETGFTNKTPTTSVVPEHPDVVGVLPLAAPVQEHRTVFCWKCHNVCDNAHDDVCDDCGWVICPHCQACDSGCKRNLLNNGVITEADMAKAAALFEGEAGHFLGLTQVNQTRDLAYDLDWQARSWRKNGWDDDARAFTQQLYYLLSLFWRRKLHESQSLYTVDVPTGDPGDRKANDAAKRVVDGMRKRAEAIDGPMAFAYYVDPGAEVIHCITTVQMKAGYKAPATTLESDPEFFFVNAIAGMDRPSKYNFHWRDAYGSTRGLALVNIERPSDSETADGANGVKATLTDDKPGAGGGADAGGTTDNSLVGRFGAISLTRMEAMLADIRELGLPVIVTEQPMSIFVVSRNGFVTRGHWRWSVDASAVFDGERMLTNVFDRYGMKAPKAWNTHAKAKTLLGKVSYEEARRAMAAKR
jgi:hypothetical protein